MKPIQTQTTTFTVCILEEEPDVLTIQTMAPLQGGDLVMHKDFKLRLKNMKVSEQTVVELLEGHDFNELKEKRDGITEALKRTKPEYKDEFEAYDRAYAIACKFRKERMSAALARGMCD